MGLFWVPKYGFVLYPAFLWNKPMLLLFNLDASWSTYLFKLGKTVWCQRINFTKKGFWLGWNVTESSAGRVCGRWCPTERSNDLLLQFHGKKKHAHLLGWPSDQWKCNQINTITEHADHICQTELSHKEPMSQLVLCWQSVEAELKYSFPFKFILTCLQLQL